MDFAALMAEQGVDVTAPAVPEVDTADTDLEATDLDTGVEVEGEVDASATPETEDTPLVAEGQPAEGAEIGLPNGQPVPPELQPLQKQLQADYTRKTQAHAEAVRAFQQDPVTQAVRTVQQLAQSDPAGLVQYLRSTLDNAIAHAQQQGFQLDAAAGSEDQPADDFGDLDPELLTETEAALHRHNQGLRQKLEAVERQLQQYAPAVQQVQVETAKAQIDAAFTKIEKDILGRTLTPEDRDSLATYATQNGCRSMAQLVELSKSWDYDNAVRRGRDQASKVVEQKRQSVVPGSRTAPPARAAAPASAGGDGRSRIEAMFDEALAGR